MGIDYMIDFDCEPKRALTVEGLMGRLKSRDRAKAVIQLYRDNGDDRPPSKMGFEMVRRRADGTEEVEIVVVQSLLDSAEELTPWEPYCTDCPANRSGQSFGCTSVINYPLSAAGERWLLDQLPDNEHPLPSFLLKRALQDFNYTGAVAASLRSQAGVFFESEERFERDIDGVLINSDHVFEMLFLSGPILPAHGSMLLQFFGGISPDLEADEIMQLGVPPSQEWLDAHTPFLHRFNVVDDTTIFALKMFLHAVYVGWRVGANVLLDV
jgi:hypothetical protein